VILFPTHSTWIPALSDLVVGHTTVKALFTLFPSGCGASAPRWVSATCGRAPRAFMNEQIQVSDVTFEV
jgi:hypothetical protein